MPCERVLVLELEDPTPFYVNFTPNLPDGCRYRLRDANPLIPEIVSCDLPGLDVGAQKALKLPVTMVAGAPRGHLYNIGLAAPIGTTDVELNQNDNLDGPGVLNTDSASGRSAERGNPAG